LDACLAAAKEAYEVVEARVSATAGNIGRWATTWQSKVNGEGVELPPDVRADVEALVASAWASDTMILLAVVSLHAADLVQQAKRDRDGTLQVRGLCSIAPCGGLYPWPDAGGLTASSPE
jgi:hypothetical protein